jgi:mannan endo-1,4-beta-mannosidase
MRLSDRLTVVVVLVMVAALGIFFAGRHHLFAGAPQATPISTNHYYLGVSEANEIASYSPVDKFARNIGRQPNIVLYYAAWNDPFETRLANSAYAHGAIPFVQIDPAPATMASIAAGSHDAYIKSYADAVRSYRHPVIIGFAAEMNGDWDSWGWKHTSPATWVAAWKHFVTVFRQQGASNVTWIWTVSQINNGTGPVQDWWPGSNYVTWIGIDGYYYRKNDTFATVFGKTIIQLRMFTGKPLLLSETAIGQGAGQVAKIPDLFGGVRENHMLGFVWFDRNQDGGVYKQDWQLTSPAAVAVFRRELKNY